MIVSPCITNSSGDLSTIIAEAHAVHPGRDRPVPDRARASCPLQQVPSRRPGRPPGDRHRARARRRATNAAGRVDRRATRERHQRGHRRRAVLLALLRLRRRDRRTSPPAQAPTTPKTRSASGCSLLLLGVAVALRRGVPAGAVLLRAARVAGAPGQGRCRRVYFAALGLGFMFFEITMIQRLVRFLGYPDLFAHGHARVAPRVHRGRRARRASGSRRAPARSCRSLLGVLAALTLFYELRASILDGRRCSTGPRGPGARRGRSCSRRSGCASACSCRSGSGS